MSTSQVPAPPADKNDASTKRRLKQLEGNHRDWQEQVQKDLRRQRLEIDALKRDNEQFQQQLNELRATEAATNVGDGSLHNKDSKNYRRSKELDVKRDTQFRLETKLRAETTRLQDLDRQIDEVRGMLKLARKGRGSVNVTAESHDLVNRQVTVLENRLDQSLQSFNDVLRQNKELRDQIDTLRGERDVFDSIYQKLEAELQEKKKEMAFIIEVSNIAYEESHNSAQVLKNLKQFAQEEMQSFAETFKELDDLLEEDRKMKEKVKERIAALEKKERASEKLTDEDRETRRKQQGQTQKQSAPAGGGDAKSESVAAQVAAYEEAFMKIRDKTGISDLKELVDKFLHAEESNFSLFSYVNDLTKEIESLEKERAHYLEEIERISMGNEADQERRAMLRNLEEKLRQEEQKNQKYKDNCDKTEGILKGIMTTVDQIFTKLGCDESTIVEQHGIAGLTLDTLLLHLAAIELRTDDYLVAWAHNARQSDKSDRPQLFLGRQAAQAPYDSTQLQIPAKNLPGTGEDAEASDDDERPLTREELIRKAQKKLSAQAVNEKTRVRGGKPKGNTVLSKK